ncbi:MAG: hypothetical protein HYY06_07070 [Deltaproteobacteria bacterium]|nr:hypothetical protein [Deltaproteobacteria bacterium]
MNRTVLGLVVVAVGCVDVGDDDFGDDERAPPPACDCADDGIACTTEGCDEEGQCVHRPDDRSCPGGGACSVAACDVEAGGCVVVPRSTGTLCGPAAPNGGPPRGCSEGECMAGEAIGMDPFGTFEVPGVAADAPSGFAVQLARVDDRSGDGLDEVAAASVPLDGYLPAPTAGSVTLFSPATGTLLWTSTGSADNLSFGYRLIPIGDLNGDGLSDLACTEEVLGVLAVVALDASTGAPLWRHEEPEAAFLRIASGGDHDGDGVDDLLVAAGVGLAILSGVTGDVVRAVTGTFGPNLGTTPDLDGDGKDDVIADAQPGQWRYVRVVSSATLEDLVVIERADEHVWFSGRTADLDGSGSDEVLLTHSDDTIRIREARDLVTGVVVWEDDDPRAQPVTTFDLDGDGIFDLVTDGRLVVSQARSIRAISGADATEIFSVEPLDTSGTLVPIDDGIIQIDDLDGDGTDDWAVGDEAAGARVWLFTTKVQYSRVE